MVNSWLMRDSLHWGLGRIAPRCLGSPQAPRMKGGPVLHLEHTRRGVWAGPPPPNWSVLARLEADILIGQRESYRLSTTERPVACEPQSVMLSRHLTIVSHSSVIAGSHRS